MHSFSFIERIIFGIFVILLVGSTLGIAYQLNTRLLTTIPAPGGIIREGIIGSPRFVHPLLAVSDADRDITALVYSGLLKATPDGMLTPDLAQSYDISPDGLTYTFTLRNNAVFHDGVRVTADDVVFTIELAQNDILKSPRRVNWEGVTVAAVDRNTVVFQLNQSYAPFLENMTLGIVPKHIWQSVPVEQIAFNSHNINPVGSGPYMIDTITYEETGIPRTYVLTAFDQYTLGAPYITHVHFSFYANQAELEEAFAEKQITNIHSISPAHAAEFRTTDTQTITATLPRVFGVFFNQSQAEVFTSATVREALSVAVDRNDLVRNVLHGFGQPLISPMSPYTEPEDIMAPADATQADESLDAAGWTYDPETGVRSTEDTTLRFTLSTSNAPELQATAQRLQEQWSAIGADVTIDFYDTGALNQEVIRPRQYDALLFGQIMGRTPDPFAFWHSSQIDDPGLNVAGYANITADNLLEKMRTTHDRDERIHLYEAFAEELAADNPAVILYAPDFTYIVDARINGLTLHTLTSASERFLTIHEWYLDTQRVWPFFTS